MTRTAAATVKGQYASIDSTEVLMGIVTLVLVTFVVIAAVAYVREAFRNGDEQA